MRVKVFYGMLGITLFYASVVQALGLAGVNFGEVPIMQGWRGGLLPTPLAMAATWLFYLSLRKSDRENRL